MMSVDVRIIGKTNLRPAQLEDLAERCRLAVHPDNVPGRSEDAVVERAGGADVLLVNAFTPISRRVVSSLPTVKAIVSCSSGIDHIDLAACDAAGIDVKWFPGYCARTVAEKTIALALVGLNRMAFAMRSVAAGQWEYLAFQGREAPGRLAAVIGFGATGRIVRELLRGLGFNVEATNSRTPAEEVDSLLRRADIVTLHMNLTSGTRHFLDAERLASMREGVCIVNTSRGALIDQHALVAFLRKRPDATALLDVLEWEPPQHDDELLQLENVLVLPHIGWNSEESDEFLAKESHAALVAAISDL